jgi:hypothetical protein
MRSGAAAFFVDAGAVGTMRGSLVGDVDKCKPGAYIQETFMLQRGVPVINHRL